MSDKNKIFALYRRKTEELIDSRFSKSLINNDVEINVKRGQPFKAERRGPDLEAIKSFAITYRNFSLNDPISIKNIAKMYEELQDDNPIKKEFTEIRNTLKNYLDSPTMIKMYGKFITRDKLIDTYLYGQVIHLDKNEEFEQWIGTPLGEIIYFEIVSTLTELANFIVYIDTTNQDLLKQNP
jgi:hypothetical protein